MSKKGNGNGNHTPVNTTPAWSTVPLAWQEFHGAISPKYEIGSIERDDATGFCYPAVNVAIAVFDAVNAVRPNAAAIVLLARDEHPAKDKQPVPFEEVVRRGDFVKGHMGFKTPDHRKKYHRGFYVFIDPMALEDPRIVGTLMGQAADLAKVLEVVAQPMDFWSEHISMRSGGGRSLPEVARDVQEGRDAKAAHTTGRKE
ncbi:MAG: hypothetical protein EB060_08780 [Proteobacteria bacterium]|nr:hypothetical protein [Pseudomonadota bacterium]